MKDQPELARIEVASTPEGTTLYVVGEIDLANVDDVRGRLGGELRPPKVTIDMRQLRYIDSSGIRMLIEVAQLGEDRQIDLEVVVEPESLVARVLALGQLERIYAIRTTAPD